MKTNVTDAASGTVYIDREYVRRCMERMALLNCDSAETKATVAGNSLKRAMDQFKEDLIEALKDRNKG